MASPEPTKNFCGKYPSLNSKILGKTNFSASLCGFGCYRVSAGIEIHKKSLEKAIIFGINLIDTSSNYADGESEKLVGNVVGDLISSEKILRDEIIVVSKGGYLQGKNLQIGLEKEENGQSFPDVTKCSPDLWHCIHPDFLEDQIDLSLERLSLDYIDVYLLHNPEYFLTYSDIPNDEVRIEEYYIRIRNAFVHLENEVNAGRIKYYGISSNTFGLPETKPNFTSLEKIIEIANSISENNHFAVVQLPLNLLERGAADNKNQNDGTKTFLQLAKEANLGVLINRPLNSIINNKLIRLADFSVTENRDDSEIAELITDLENQEKLIDEKYVQNISLSPVEKKQISDCLTIANFLKTNKEEFTGPSHFQEIKTQFLVPRANFAINHIGKHFDDEIAVRTLRNYAVTANIIFESFFSRMASKKNEKNLLIHEQLSSYLRDDQKTLGLSQKAVLMINSLPEVTSTLVGMRTVEYVDDIVSSLNLKLVEKPHDFWKNGFS